MCCCLVVFSEEQQKEEEEEEEPLAGKDEEERRIAEMGRPMLGDHVKVEVIIEESYEFKVRQRCVNTTNLIGHESVFYFLFGPSTVMWPALLIGGVTEMISLHESDPFQGSEITLLIHGGG